MHVGLDFIYGNNFYCTFSSHRKKLMFIVISWQLVKHYSVSSQISKLTAASTLAGESPLGSANMEITLIMMVSTVWMGSQRSSGFS